MLHIYMLRSFIRENIIYKQILFGYEFDIFPKLKIAINHCDKNDTNEMIKYFNTKKVLKNN